MADTLLSWQRELLRGVSLCFWCLCLRLWRQAPTTLLPGPPAPLLARVNDSTPAIFLLQ